jgi:hypothetical protein
MTRLRSWMNEDDPSCAVDQALEVSAERCWREHHVPEDALPQD